MLGRKTTYLQSDNWTVFLDGEADGVEHSPTEMSLTLAHRGKIHLGCTRGYSSPASPGQTHTHTHTYRHFHWPPHPSQSQPSLSDGTNTHTHSTLGITLFNPAYRVPDKYTKSKKNKYSSKLHSDEPSNTSMTNRENGIIYTDQKGVNMVTLEPERNDLLVK